MSMTWPGVARMARVALWTAIVLIDVAGVIGLGFGLYYARVYSALP